ncbi:hypothetical protein FOXB_02517 [Fusarium oxysporum f. sp. conglutinans Fo5176]|uniref:BRCT domain-containing protein n=2 Tax=Fusarium oxysporum TaxID=5507 RepID=F9F7Z2_FUSOF|nr:hypothetical protein FOXB_02517 [Fusarium oxysporum f. sp. conglutinans Fo5176]
MTKRQIKSNLRHVYHQITMMMTIHAHTYSSQLCVRSFPSHVTLPSRLARQSKPPNHNQFDCTVQYMSNTKLFTIAIVSQIQQPKRYDGVSVVKESEMVLVRQNMKAASAHELNSWRSVKVDSISPSRGSTQLHNVIITDNTKAVSSTIFNFIPQLSRCLPHSRRLSSRTENTRSSMSRPCEQHQQRGASNDEEILPITREETPHGTIREASLRAEAAMSDLRFVATRFIDRQMAYSRPLSNDTTECTWFITIHSRLPDIRIIQELATCPQEAKHLLSGPGRLQRASRRCTRLIVNKPEAKKHTAARACGIHPATLAWLETAGLARAWGIHPIILTWLEIIDVDSRELDWASYESAHRAHNAEEPQPCPTGKGLIDGLLPLTRNIFDEVEGYFKTTKPMASEPKQINHKRRRGR